MSIFNWDVHRRELSVGESVDRFAMRVAPKTGASLSCHHFFDTGFPFTYFVVFREVYHLSLQGSWCDSVSFSVEIRQLGRVMTTTAPAETAKPAMSVGSLSAPVREVLATNLPRERGASRRPESRVRQCVRASLRLRACSPSRYPTKAAGRHAQVCKVPS